MSSNSIRLTFVKKTSMQTLSKFSDRSSNIACVALYLLKAPAILSDTTVRRSPVDREDLKLDWKSGKEPHFSTWSTIPLFTSFSNTLLTTKRRLTGWYVLPVDLSPNILKYRERRWNLPTIWKTRVFQTHVQEFS